MPKRALVLGGGGPVGIAWEAGVLLGLAEAGVDLTAVDHVVGTSAGAFIGARVALGHSPGDIAAPYAPREPRSSGAEGKSSAKEPSELVEAPNLAFLFQMIQEAARAGRSGAEITRELGAFALDAKTMSEEEFVGRFTSKLRSNGVGAWPSRSFICTAFDAHDGSFKIWDAAAGADLASAVASSCAVPGVYPSITIGGRRYFDGGILSTTNAHLAKGYDLVFVLTVTEVLMRFADGAREKKTPLQREVQALRDGGAQVEVIAFDTDALQAIGPNFMDHTRQSLGLQEGLRQGRAEAARLAPMVAK
ncbi:MAG TPA: patatin-like phospholipase family protein [Polyangiaceae bacterium]|nr:patatin-like phospholipase family protein [Polyangiaceae bacterium]